ncbi:acetyl-CoA carboxylase, partial [Tanacetum coccineum]
WRVKSEFFYSEPSQHLANKNVAALHSHDYSVERRHQKVKSFPSLLLNSFNLAFVSQIKFFGYVNIIEEGLITVAPQETIKKLEQAARRLAKSVDYVRAATAEYLYSMETEDYYFLELNPRLQV